MSRVARAGLALAALLHSAPATSETPEVLYMLNCQGCHRPDGSGLPGAVPSLAELSRFLATPEGRAYLVQVPGSANAPLSDGELAVVLNWMARRFAPGAVARPYTAEEVALHRATRLEDVVAARRRILGRTDP